jgi:hypothetical protein
MRPITAAARSKAWTVVARSNTGMVGSNPTRGRDVCVRLFCICIVLCVGSGTATGWFPVQGVLPTVYRIKKLKKKRPRSKGLYSHGKRERDPIISKVLSWLSADANFTAITTTWRKATCVGAYGHRGEQCEAYSVFSTRRLDARWLITKKKNSFILLSKFPSVTDCRRFGIQISAQKRPNLTEIYLFFLRLS